MGHKSVEEFKVETVEVGGFVGAFSALHLPFGKDCASIAGSECGIDGRGQLTCSSFITPSEGDMGLLERLRSHGDEHAKVLRGIMVWCEINAPRYWWQEMATYRIGSEQLSSESTMHIQGRGLSRDELVEMKENLPEGFMQRRVWMFSYQTLGRVYRQRKNHRLPQWRLFCDWIRTLPYSELIIGTEGK